MGSTRLNDFVLVTLLGFTLYLPLLSNHYDLNGITEAQAVEEGAAGDLFMPNHMLFRPTGYAVWHTARALGYPGEQSLYTLQALSAVFGALGLGFMYLALARITPHGYVALGTVLLLGTSMAYWLTSTDVAYITMAVLLVASTLALFLHSRSRAAQIGCGVLSGIAILVWQVNIFLLAALALAVWRVDSVGDRREDLLRIGVMGVSAALVVGVPYLFVGALVFGVLDPLAMLAWASNYAGPALPMYGSWELRDLFDAPTSLFQSVLAVQFLEIAALRTRMGLGAIPGWLAPVGFVCLMASLLSASFYRLPRKSREFRLGLWALSSYGLYVLFISWWDATEVRWLAVPNLFLALMVALAASRLATRRHARVIFLGGVLVIALLNFRSTIFPRRFEPSVTQETAACVAANMRSEDLFLASEWNWVGYLPYLHDRDAVNLLAVIPEAGGLGPGLERVGERVARKQAAGGTVFVIDPAIYSPTHLEWLNAQVGLSRERLDALKGSAAFECNGIDFHELNPRSIPAPR